MPARGRHKLTGVNEIRGSKLPHVLYGKLGPASKVRRLDPKTLKVIEEGRRLPKKDKTSATYTRRSDQ